MAEQEKTRQGISLKINNVSVTALMAACQNGHSLGIVVNIFYWSQTHETILLDERFLVEYGARTKSTIEKMFSVGCDNNIVRR